jgi:predicted TIM-barrel fold metal-dependent hydrolase
MLQADSDGRTAEVLDQFVRLGFGRRLMFSSDYPHWDFDAPETVFPPATPLDVRRQVLGTNAADLYGIHLPT